MVSQFDIEKMQRVEVRVFLNLMGVVYKRHPKTAGAIRDLALKYTERYPEKAVEMFGAVKYGNKNASIVDSPKSKDVDDIVTSVVNILSKEHGASLHSIKKDVVSFAKEVAKEVAIQEMGIYRPLELKQKGKKSVKLKGVLPKQFEKLLQLAHRRRNILMVGPAGCGKTYIAGKIAEALGLSFASQSCSEGMSETAFTGWLMPIGKQGTFEYVQSEFVRIYEGGGVFLLDEIDASDSNVLVFMNQALANDGFYLPQRHNKPFIKKHKDFVAIAAANTFGNGGDAMYVGRNQLDAATLDRFKIGTVYMDYDETVEKALIQTRCELVYEWGILIREKITRHNLRRILSTRVMIDSVEMREEGWSLKEISDAYFSDWSREELRMVA